MTTDRPRCPSGRVIRGLALPRAMCLATITLMIVGISMAQTALADTGDDLRTAVAAARGTACGPMRPDSVADQAAAAINATTDRWINNTARAVPEVDAVPLLKDLGSSANKAAILSGAAQDGGDAIRALLLEGFAKLPDCSYTEYGVSAMYNAKKDLILTTVVLAG